MSKKINFNQIKNHLKDNKVSLLLLLAILLIGTGTTYALWQLTFSQTSTNVITTACFKIEFEGQNDINLENAFPVTDEEGKKLTPYDFTITNVCTNEANYYVNLETVTSATKKLSDYYLKANLLKGDEEVFLGNLNSSYINTERVISTASEAYKLYQGYLKANETATFHLNLWLDDSTDITDEVMNATYEGKITVTTSYKEPVAKNLMVAMETEYQWDPGVYDSILLNATYLQGEKYADSIIDKIVFEDTIKPYENAEEVVDFSVAQDRSVLGYYVKNGETEYSAKIYTLYIQADGKIKVNQSGSYYFMTDSYYGDNCVEGLQNLDTGLTTNMSAMFAFCKNSNLDLSRFDTSNITKMKSMFLGCENLTNIDLSGFNTSKVTDMDFMFKDCSKLINLDLSNFDTSKVTSMSSMFYGCSSLTELNLTSLDTSKVTNMEHMFTKCMSITDLDLTPLDTSNVTNMSAMFAYMENLISIDLSNFDTSNVKKFTNFTNGPVGMFEECKKLISLNLSSFNTKQITSMINMFANCQSLTSLDLSSFDTSQVTNMNSMFEGCSSLTNLDMGSFNTSKVTDMSSMFSRCSSLTSLSLNSFDTKNVTKMTEMFFKCGNLINLDLGSFDMSNVLSTNLMFKDCTKLNAAITINSSKISPNSYQYAGIFSGTATEEGSEITVNYIAETSDLVDQMIATKSDKSNVVKGTLIS